MPKGFSNKLCIYCNKQKSTPVGDHILPRSFFLDQDRGNIPKVPACKNCNNEKSQLEHHLATVLPFGGKHRSASENLTSQVPKRLAKNVKLHRQLHVEKSRVWVKEPSGLITRRLAIPLEGDKYTKFFEYAGKALLWHHWKLRVPDGHDIASLVLTSTGEDFFCKLFKLRSEYEVKGSIGDDVFNYHGKRSNNKPLLCVWMFSLYGGIDISDGVVVSKNVGVLIATSKHIKSLTIH